MNVCIAHLIEFFSPLKGYKDMGELENQAKRFDGKLKLDEVQPRNAVTCG